MQLFVSAAATLPSRAIPYVVAKAAMLSTDGSKVTMAGLVLFGSGVKDMWLDDDEITRISGVALSLFYLRSAQGSIISSRRPLQLLPLARHHEKTRR
jgi:hypothetical protein